MSRLLKETIYMKPEVKAAAKLAAKRANRSFSNYTETALIAEINRRDKTLIEDARKALSHHGTEATEGIK